MKQSRTILGFALGAAVALVGAHAVSQQDSMAPPSPEVMEKVMAAMQPGPYHEKLQPFVGEWNLETKIWMGGPDTPPMESTGTASVAWILDGRFIRENMDATIRYPGPTGEIIEQPMKGEGTTGYDNNRNLYVSSWIDNMGTQMLTMKGQANPEFTRFTQFGEMDEPMLGVYGRYVKYVTTIVDEDTRVFSIIDLHAGDDYKVMEVTYTRKD